jgi:hypothetical protein
MNIFISTKSLSRLISRYVLPGLVLLGVSACSPMASVDDKDPILPVAVAPNDENPQLKVARLQAESATQLVESDPKAALSESANAARISLDQMKHLSSDQEKEAIVIYNFSVARMMDAINELKQEPWKDAIKIDGPHGPLWLSLKSDSDQVYTPGEDKFEVTDRMIVSGRYFTERVRIDGVGAPLVVTGAPGKEPWSPTKHFVPATALASFSGSNVMIDVVSPSVTPTTSLAGKQRPVAADLSAPIAVQIVETHPEMIGFLALLNSGKYEKGARLVMMEPYRPGVQPVILVHGLMDSPLSWVPQINTMNANPALRKKYQIWYFQYPTGPPFPISAEILREQLAAVYEKYPKTPKAIIVGHSMGGLLAHMLMCDSGTQYSKDLLGKTVAELKLSPDDKVLAGALEFKASPYIAKVIFEATPHRGAVMASNPIGRLGSMLVRLPVKMVTMGPSLISDATATNGGKVIQKFPNSIDTFRPDALCITAMDKLTLNPEVPYYSIIGDVDNKTDVEKSTDYVVPYTSSHLAGAQSEKIVPYWHSEVLMGPESISEVERILLAN